MDRTLAPMRTTPELDARAGLEKLADLSLPDPRPGSTTPGYPVSVAVEAAIDPTRRDGHVRRAGRPRRCPTDRPVSLTGSHIRPQPGLRLRRAPPRDGLGPRHRHRPGDAASPPTARHARRRPRLGLGRGRGARSSSTPSAPYRPVAQVLRRALARSAGTPVKPRLSLGFLALRTTRLPFLSATHRARSCSASPIAAAAGLVRPADGRADDHRSLPRAPRRSTSRNDVFDTRSGRGRRERHADPVQRAARGSSSTGW